MGYATKNNLEGTEPIKEFTTKLYTRMVNEINYL